MNIIAFGHRQRVGKDTAVKFLVQHLRTSGNKGRIEKGSLAYEMKLQCYKLFGYAGMKHPDHYETESGADDKELLLPIIGKTVRQIWIEYAIGLQNISTTALIDYLLNVSKDTDTLVISDLRRPAEANRIKQKGGHVIRIDRPDTPKATDIIDMAMSSYDEWDDVIVNDGDLKKLYSETIRVADKFKL